MRLLLVSTHQLSACTPSMSAEQTPEPMMTGRSCMKVVGKLSEPSLLMLSGKRSMRNGQRDQQRNCPSGLVRGQARKLVMLRLLRVRKRVVKKHQQTKKIMMKRKKKRRKRKKRKSKSYALDKSTFDLPKHLWIFFLNKKNFILSASVLQILQAQGRRSSTHS